MGGIPLIVRAIRKANATGVFDEIWVNSEHTAFGNIAKQENVNFHRRQEELASNTVTSEDFVYEFMKKHPSDYLFQIHSIAPLLSSKDIAKFVNFMIEKECDVLLSCTKEQIECAIDGQPINFAFDAKTNSQNLNPVQRITWSITGWRPEIYISAYEAGKCATYSGHVGFCAIDRLAGHIIKTEEDLRIAEALLLIHPEL